jgi:glycosyltransferase involved in cell wall biosynthesis
VDLLREMEAIADLPSGEPLPPSLAAPPRAQDAQVAIVIPCFNHGEFLLEAIASVERTVSVPYELIIVNDGSRDRHTLEVLACLRRAGYRIIDQDNRGVAEARNRGIREANRGIFLPLDADNRLRPGFVEVALDVLARDRSVMAVYGDRTEYGLRSGRVEVGVPDLDRLLCGNYIDACAVIRLEAWRACGGYDPEMPVQGSEDWDLWLSMLERGFSLHRLDMETFDYRVRPESMLSEHADPEVQAAIERYVLAKHSPFYLQHLRRQVGRRDIIAMTLADTEAQLTALRRTTSSSEARRSEASAGLPRPMYFVSVASDQPITHVPDTLCIGTAEIVSAEADTVPDVVLADALARAAAAEAEVQNVRAEAASACSQRDIARIAARRAGAAAEGFWRGKMTALEHEVGLLGAAEAYRQATEAKKQADEAHRQAADAIWQAAEANREAEEWRGRYEGLRARLIAILRRYGILRVSRIVPASARRFVRDRLLGPGRR